MGTQIPTSNSLFHCISLARFGAQCSLWHMHDRPQALIGKALWITYRSGILSI